MSMFQRPSSVIGLDLGASAVKAVEMQAKGDVLEVTGFGQIEVEPDNDQALREAVSNLFAEGGFQARRVASSVSGKMIIVRHIQVDRCSGDQLEEAVRFEAEKYLPFPVDEAILDWTETGDQDSQTMDLLLVAAKREQIEEHLEQVSGGGLKPEVVDVDAFAIANAYELCGEAEEEVAEGCVAFVDVGARKSTINISSGGVSRFTREVSIGGNEFTETLARILNMPFEEAEDYKRDSGEGAPVLEEALAPSVEELANEIQLSFEWFQNQYSQRVDRVLVTGGGARLPFFNRLFSEVLNLQVSGFDPLASVVLGEGLDEELLKANASQLAVATGLAARLVKS